jgi:acetolactate synthase-1/2/3 large subunit
LPPLFGTDQKWIQIDINPEEIGRNRPVDIGIVGDAKEVLKEMTHLAKGKVWGAGSWVEECHQYLHERLKRMEPDLLSDKTPIHPLRLCHEIGKFVNRDAILTTDGGDIAVFAAISLKVYHPGHWLDMGNMGFLGTAIPFGIAAKLSNPQKQVLVLTGDGSFGFNGMELDTAIRHKIPIVVVIANDGAWGMIKHRQQLIYGRTIGTELGFTHYERMVQALGGYGEYIERAEEIPPALERAFASGLPSCLNVKTDPTAVSPVTLRTAKLRG